MMWHRCAWFWLGLFWAAIKPFDAAQAETLNWNYPAANVNIVATPSTTTVNTVSITTSGAASGGFTLNTHEIQPAFSTNGSSVGVAVSRMDATTDNLTSFQTTTVRFSEPVYNLSFNVIDIDGGPAFNNGTGSNGWNDIIDFNSDGGFPTAVVADATWVAYNAATGRASAISNQNAVSGTANQNNGTITVTFPGPITFFSVRHHSGPINNPAIAGNETDAASQIVVIDDVTFTRSARLALNKTSIGGTGTFNFSNSNGLTFTSPSTYTYGATTFNVATTTAGVGVTSANQILGVVNQAATITETGPAIWVMTTTLANCTDANSAVSGNAASFTVPVANNIISVPAANVRAGAVITCSVTNNLAAPALAVLKSASPASVSAVGTTVTYTIAVSNSGNTTLTNINMADPLGTVICPSSGASLVNTLAPGTSENCSMSYVTTQAQFDTNGGGDGDIDNTASASATYKGTPVTANGSAAVALSLTPGLSIVKSANTPGPVNAGNVISYTFQVTNTGNVTINNVTVGDSHNGFGTAPVPGSESLFNDVAPLGNSTDAAVNGSWNTLAPGDTIQFTANYTVLLADIENLQ
jgi:uncharacterized repeat protein (TIGR01451 family)